MNFTLDVKKEIISKGIHGENERLAALSAFIRTSGIVGVRDGKPAFFIVSETEKVAEFFTSVFEGLFQEPLVISRATVDRMSGRGKLILEYTGERTEEILKALAIPYGSEEDGAIDFPFDGEEERIAFIKGAFLGCGSCTLPDEKKLTATGYHLEFDFARKEDAFAFSESLLELELIGKVVSRNSGYITYIKSKELISDFLAIIGAENSLKKFSELVKKRDKANHQNRAANCYSGNADKTAAASVKQIMLIQRLKESGEFFSIGSDLKETANARIENPTLSMQELADKIGVTKSCLNHRLRKLIQLAQKTENKGNGR